MVADPIKSAPDGQGLVERGWFKLRGADFLFQLQDFFCFCYRDDHGPVQGVNYFYCSNIDINWSSNAAIEAFNDHFFGLLSRTGKGLCIGRSSIRNQS